MFEDALRRLRDLERRVADLDGEHTLTFEDLFPDEFMLRNTQFPSVDALIQASPFEADSAEAFAAIPDDEWDKYISEVTRFTSWAEMRDSAAQEWALRRLDLE